MVSISDDNGDSWIPLAVGLSTNEFTFDAPANILSDMVLVRVTVSDGINTADDVLTNSFTMKPFPAGGQRSDVNDFIAFSAPLEKTTVLSSGTNEFKIIINYGKTIDPITFEATLNGIDVSSSFNPIPGTHETILLSLDEGRNTLKMTVDGIREDGRNATDRDSLGFNIG